MATWWMNEGAGDDDDHPSSLRGTVVKRFDASPSLLPPDLATALAADAAPACAGPLDKLASSAWAAWQPRHWELRGCFLVYYKPQAKGGSGNGLPLGAIDLRHVTSVKLTTSPSQELVLKSSTRTFRLRASAVAASSAMAAAAEPPPSLATWEARIGSVRDASRLSPDDGLAHRAVDHDSGSAQGEAEVIITDVYDDDAPSSSFESAATTNPLAPPLRASAASLRGDVELRTSVPKGGGGGDDRNGVTVDLRKSSPGGNGGCDDRYSGGGPGGSEAAVELPHSLRRVLRMVGVQQGSGRFAGAMMWLRRMVIFNMIWTLGAKKLISLITPTADGGTEAYASFVINATDGFNCAPTLVYEEGSPVPCVMVAAYLGTWPIYCLCSIIVYVWLIRNNDMAKLLRTHRARMAKYVDKFARICLGLQLSLMVILGVFIGVADNTTGGEGAVDGVELVPSWWGRFFLLFVQGALFALILLPGYVLTLIFYAETRRLRLILKDFHELMNRRPFDYEVVGPAYWDMANEFEATQAHMGNIINVHMGGLVVALGGEFILVIYYRVFVDVNRRLHNSSSYVLVLFLEAALVFVEFLPSLLLGIYALVGVNERAKLIPKNCTEIMAYSASDRRQARAHEVGGGTAEADAAGPLRQRAPSSQHTSSRLLSGAELPAGRHDLGGGGGVHARSRLRSIGDGVLDAMKLAAVVDRRPCQLTVLGRSITWADVTSVLALAVATQLLNVFGLG